MAKSSTAVDSPPSDRPLGHDEAAPNDAVTLVIQHRVRRGESQGYEAWLKRTVTAARKHPGHLGVNVIRPGEDGQVFTSVLRFSEARLLQGWLESSERRALVEEVLPLLEEGDHPLIHADPEFWFTPSGQGAGQPPKWKQAVLSYLVILPLSIVIPLLWQPVFARYPALGGLIPSNMLITACIVGSVVFVIMPRVTRLFARWLAST